MATAKKSTKKKPPKPAAKAAAAKTAKKPAKATFPKDRSRYKKPLLILAGILVLAAAAIAANYNNAAPAVPQPEVGDPLQARDFSNGIIEHLRKGECAQIADKTSLGFQAVITEEQWLASCNVASGVLRGEASEVELEDSNFEDDITEFTYRILATDKETYVITTELVYRDGEWQLQGINSQVEE